jgi:hypothetical protein
MAYLHVDEQVRSVASTWIWELRARLRLRRLHDALADYQRS